MCGIKKNGIDDLIYKANIHSEQTYGYQGGRGG